MNKHSVKIKIIQSVKNSIEITKQESKIIISFCFLAFLIFFVFNALENYTVGSTMIISEWLINRGFVYFDPSPYVYAVFDNLIYSFYAVGLYRYLILGSDERYTYEYRRGVEKQKIIFTLKYFLRFKKHELYVFLFSSALVFAFNLLNNLNIELFSSYLQESGVIYLSDQHKIIFRGIDWSLRIIEHLTYALLILVWPLLAVSEKITVQDIKQSIIAIYGNIISITIVGVIIYLPYYFTVSLNSSLTYLLYDYFDKHQAVYLIISDISDALIGVVSFTCLCMYIVFSSLLFKTFSNRDYLG